MTDEVLLLEALRRNPGDGVGWLALADALEEAGQEQRADLCRLTHRLRRTSLKAAERDKVQSAAQELLRAGVEPCMPRVINSIGMSLTLIPAGVFVMGSPRGEMGRVQGEGPRHRVEITRSFYLGTYEVTQAEYVAVMGRNPSYFQVGRDWPGIGKGTLDTSRHPVERVSWHDAAEFCLNLSQRREEQQAGREYRLPTEAEWEYACRAGTTTTFFSGNTFTSLQANFDGKYPYSGPLGPHLGRTTAVGEYSPNLWGLYDMTGNLWEWCADWYSPHYYTRGRMVDPQGPAEGDRRCRRGGSWYMNATHCRSGYRSSNTPSEEVEFCGFRVVMVEKDG